MGMGETNAWNELQFSQSVASEVCPPSLGHEHAYVWQIPFRKQKGVVEGHDWGDEEVACGQEAAIRE